MFTRHLSSCLPQKILYDAMDRIVGFHLVNDKIGMFRYANPVKVQCPYLNLPLVINMLCFKEKSVRIRDRDKILLVIKSKVK